MLNAELLQYSLQIAVFAFVYSVILTDTGMILESFKRRLFNITHRKQVYLMRKFPADWQDNYSIDVYSKVYAIGIRFKIVDYRWLYKILIDCERCVAGQVSLWLYIIRFNYDFIQHVSFITTSILLTDLLKRIWQRLS